MFATHSPHYLTSRTKCIFSVHTYLPSFLPPSLNPPAMPSSFCILQGLPSRGIPFHGSAISMLFTAGTPSYLPVTHVAASHSPVPTSGLASPHLPSKPQNNLEVPSGLLSLKPTTHASSTLVDISKSQAYPGGLLSKTHLRYNISGTGLRELRKARNLVFCLGAGAADMIATTKFSLPSLPQPCNAISPSLAHSLRVTPVVSSISLERFGPLKDLL